MKSRFKIEEIKHRDNKNKALNNWNSSDIYVNSNVHNNVNGHIIDMIKIYFKFIVIFIVVFFIVAFLVIKIRAENLNPNCHCEERSDAAISKEDVLTRTKAGRADMPTEALAKVGNVEPEI